MGLSLAGLKVYWMWKWTGWGRPYTGINNDFKDNFKDILKDNHVHFTSKNKMTSKGTHIEAAPCLNFTIFLTLGHLDCEYEKYLQ